MKTKAIVTGSFDPITVGHADIIRRGAAMFDEVYVVVLNNADKTHMFTEAQRKAMAEAVADELREEGITGITVDSYSGLTADYMRAHGITTILRGVRNERDRIYEMELAAIMREFYPDCTTLLLESRPEYAELSSTDVRQAIDGGRKYAHMLTPAVARLIESMI